MRPQERIAKGEEMLMHAVGAGLIARFKALWPMFIGIICARTALIVACYGSYSATDDGVFTDGAMLVTCGIFAIALLILHRTGYRFTDQAARAVFIVSIAVAATSAAALATFDTTNSELFPAAFALSVVCTLSLSGCMFFWLRCLRGTDEVTAALFVFGAFMASVVIVYFLSFIPTVAQNIIGAILIAAQLLFIGPASARDALVDQRRHRRARTFFTFANSHIQDNRFLIACTIGMACLGFVDGFLRGYPDGLPIPFTAPTRAAYVVAVLVVCLVMAVFVVRRRERVMTVGIFVVMELLASLSLVLFGAFPNHWEIGAVAVNTLNILICAFCWYVIIAFISFGDQDPYYYALGGWVVCFGTRAVGRMLLLSIYSLTGNDIFINSLLGALILISAQVVLIQFLMAEHGEWETEAEHQRAEKEEALREAEETVARTEASMARTEAALAQAESALDAAISQIVGPTSAGRATAGTTASASASPVAPGAGKGAAVAAAGASATASEHVSSPTSAVPNAPSSMDVLSDSMRRNIERMGQQFLLSSREVDVLTLYALGHTQKKVAEELYITPATAHTHIKRIYSKCGMHSRQEILEYLATYGS